MITPSRLLSVLLALCMAAPLAGADPCADLNPFVLAGRLAELENPARRPTDAESARIEAAALELLQQAEYGKGAVLVDANNDGREELVVWNISGSLRYAYTELRGWTPAPAAENDLPLLGSLFLGVLNDPQFVRVGGVNYVVMTDSGSEDDMTVSRLDRGADGQVVQRTVCRMEATLRVETSCRHPACRALASRIDDPKANQPFVAIEWPHKYFGPAGLAVYFPEEGSRGDFDNTGKPTTIWRYGRQDYLYQHIYWRLLGQGDTAPAVDPALRPDSEDPAPRSVLPGAAHDRLRRTLASQTATFAAEFDDVAPLPNEAEFFLFEAHGGRTYWAWDFGTPPTGELMHVVYTRGEKSDYIGSLNIERTLRLQPCTTDCMVDTEN